MVPGPKGKKESKDGRVFFLSPALNETSDCVTSNPSVSVRKTKAHLGTESCIVFSEPGHAHISAQSH